MHKHFHLNEGGKDFIVGDIHGCFTRLQARLDRMGFNPEVDRLFSVGDLVDRGPESHMALEWLSKPWFHAVRGNHEQMAVDRMAGFGDDRIYISNGGAWFLGMHKAEQCEYADAFSALPIAITLETAGSLLGIVHADCPLNNWQDLIDALQSDRADSYAMCCMWSRDRVTGSIQSEVEGVRAVVVGHTPMQSYTSLGNVIYIDTGAVFGREFTILDAATLRPVQ